MNQGAFYAWLVPRRQLWLTLFDVASWMGAVLLATTGRLDFSAHQVSWRRVLIAGATVAVLHVVFGWVGRLHHGRAGLGTLEELMLLAIVSGSAASALFVVNVAVGEQLVPRSVPLLAFFVAIAVMGGARAIWRRLVESERGAGREVQDAVRVLILGAGDGGRQLILSMRRASDTTAPRRRATDANWTPVGLLDDDPRKRHLRLYGVPVLGPTTSIASAAASTGASLVLVAIPSADATLIRRVSNETAEAGLKLKVVPGVGELLHDRVDIRDVRDLQLEDLLGRHQIDTNMADIADSIAGRRVLVTGAGGSIGSELCRQLHKFEPAELIMLDRDESALHSVQLSIFGRALLNSSDVVLGDIRDVPFIDDIFRTRKPQVVFHAAALKHLPLLEQYPGEAVKTNVWGTLAVLEASSANGVETFVNISTDKAANPCSVLGYSKKIAEGLTASVATQSVGTYLSVRFGNVLGSRGSVLTAFSAQIAAGGPVTVTDPDVTRFFMTVHEAVQLVIQAAAIGRDGEALILDMGESVRIDDVARQLIELSGRKIDIEYTGLRDAEKMHESLFGDGESDERPTHALVSHVPVSPVSISTARGLQPWVSKACVVASLAEVCESQRPGQAAGVVTGDAPWR